MFVGTYLIKSDETDIIYTAPFPRGGLAALFTVEATQVAGSPTLNLQVEHKNRNETAWAAAGAFSDITTEGVYTQDVTGIKQQVRIAAALSGGSQGDFVVLVLRPDGISWRP
jgi:hypothetical protein